MSAHPSPPTIDDAAAGVRAATTGLIRAAEMADAAAIDGAIRERAEAVGLLRSALVQFGGELDGSARRSVFEDVAIQAGEAEALLSRLKDSIQAHLLAQAQGSKALHGYAAPGQREGRAALDRDG